MPDRERAKSSRSRRLKPASEEVDGRDEVAFVDEHHEVDGIEVGLAVKATSQVGARVGRRQKLAAAMATRLSTARCR